MPNLSRRSAQAALAEESLDRVIDNVAPHMTEGVPPFDLRDRVLAQIRTGDVRGSWFDVRRARWAWTLAPIAAAAVVVVAIFVMRGSQPREAGPKGPALQETAPAAGPKRPPLETSSTPP